MKKISITVISITALFLASCTKNLQSLNDQTKAAANVPAGTLFSSSVRVISDNTASASVNTNVFRFIVKHWAMVTYQDEVRYDFATRAIPGAWWNGFYRSSLINLQDAARIVTEDATLSAGEKANKLAIIDLVQVYAYSILTNTFGNVPYTEALTNSILFPKYDDAKTVIYPDLLKRLTNDIAKMTTTSAGFTSTEDLLNAGNMTKWIKFANTLKMKLGMIIADDDNATAKAAVESVAANTISAATENSAFVYLTGSPNQNPLFVDIVTGGRGDYVAGKDLVDSMAKNSDPRLPYFFGKNSSGAYKGGVSGSVNSPQSDFSQPGAKVIAADAPNIFADYVETEFLKAEAVERGYAVPGTAESHYINAITASIVYWGGSLADVDAYLAKSTVKYSTAAGTWRQKIGAQKWIALYNRPFETWLEYRRLDYPVLALPVGAISGFPNRLTYPAAEQTTNGTNYTSAAAAIGGDKVETKLFWDKF